MSKDQIKELQGFLRPFDPQTRTLALRLRDFIWDLYPEANELIYDNYNALAIGWSLTDRPSHNICTIALFRTNQNLHFGFFWGSEIADPERRLIGQGKQYRYLLVKDMASFPKAYIKQLMRESHANSLAKIKDLRQIQEGRTIVKSVSPTRREKRTSR
jgi:hypothetical protein